MDPEALDRLMVQARKVAAVNDPTEIVGEIDTALEGETKPWVTGSLHLIKAIALQCVPDPAVAARSCRVAFEALRDTDDLAKTAYAAAAAAVLTHRTGDVPGTVELAVEAMTILPDTDRGAADALSATNALAQVFGALSAYGLAVDMAESAFRQSVGLRTSTRVHLAYALATCATDACHAVDDVARSRWLPLIEESADYLSTDAASPVSALVTVGVRAELALLRADDELFGSIEMALRIGDAEDLAAYPLTGDRLVPWHRLVRAAAARRWGDPTVAVDLLGLAVPQLDDLGEVTRLARALEERSRAYAALGRDALAVEDALDLVHRSRAWQMSQIGQLAEQISERAELERVRVQLLRQADLLAKEAAIDSVSGVGTRRWLEVRLNELSRSNEPVGVIMVDLDHFKKVNDDHGHATGDLVLRRIGGLLKRVIRPEDTAARYGGEEFVILVDQATSVSASLVAERIRSGLVTDDWASVAPGLSVTASIGVADGPARHVRDVLRLADTALYEAKRLGRDRIVVGQGIRLKAGRVDGPEHGPVVP